MMFLSKGTVYAKDYSQEVVDVIDGSLWRWMLHRVYHRYDMLIPIKLPGWKRLEWFLRSRGAEVMLGFEGDKENPTWMDRLVSWPYEQDFRCFALDQKIGKRIGRLNVGERIPKEKK